MVGSSDVSQRDGAARVRTVLQWLLAASVITLLAVACSDLTGPSQRCPDPDYPLSCQTNKACCPQGFPVNCGGMCYQTDAAARRSCSARLDTCYRE